MKDLARYWLVCMFVNAFLMGSVLKSIHHKPRCEPRSSDWSPVVLIALGPLTYALMAGYILTDEKGPLVERACR